MAADEQMAADELKEALREQIRYWTNLGEDLRKALVVLDGKRAPRRDHLRLVTEDEKGGE